MQPEKDNEQSVRKNRFAEISLYCFCAGLLLLCVGPPFALLPPFACIAGIISGIVGLCRAHHFPRQNSGMMESLIGITLCTVVLVPIGLLFASVGNDAQISPRLSNLRQLAIVVDRYADTHQGYFPHSISETGFPPEKLSYNIYYFYTLHFKRPYLLNGHLAGKKIGLIAYPERTILVAPGKKNGATKFYSHADIRMNEHCMAFVDGHSQYLADGEIAKRFPADGKVTDETWFIKPQWKH